MHWTKGAGDEWTCKCRPDTQFTLKVTPKGDGRWSWSVFSGEAVNPMATGIARNLGAAKNVAEQFVKRNGSG
jgi:hypothetical protein